jgi:hypothetical protein
MKQQQQGQAGAGAAAGQDDDDEEEGPLIDLEALTNSDRDFCHRCIRQLTQHLGLTERVNDEFIFFNFL